MPSTPMTLKSLFGDQSLHTLQQPTGQGPLAPPPPREISATDYSLKRLREDTKDHAPAIPPRRVNLHGPVSLFTSVN